MPPKRVQVSSLVDGDKSAVKRVRRNAVSIAAPSASGTRTPIIVGSSSNIISSSDEMLEILKEKFLKLFSVNDSVTNSLIKGEFGESQYQLLVPFINELLRLSRLSIERVPGSSELVYRLNSEEMANKYQGLDQSHRLVLQVIEKAGNRGIWTRDIRIQTSLTEQVLKKIYKTLEIRKLVKPIYAVTAARKKLYMLYELTPAREITGGPWYTEMEFDHEFIGELRMFILHCVKNLNEGKGITASEISQKMIEMKVSRIQLKMEEVKQLIQTLVYDYLIEQESVNEDGEATFVVARKVNPVCGKFYSKLLMIKRIFFISSLWADFQGWQVLARDFHFRRIKFDDGIILKAHEPHYHGA